MNDSASLQNLNEIVMPAPAPWWPLAPAWYVLAVVAAVALLWLAFRSWRRWQADRYRRQALAELSAMRPGAPDTLQALPALLKRTALACWPRDRVASLSSADWWRFPDDSSGGDAFSGSYGALLEGLSYRENAQVSDTEMQGLLAASRHWIRHHDCPERGS